MNDNTILRELSRLDETKSVGIGGISAKPLKLAKEHIVTSIRPLINQSFNECEFINEWKSAKVIPLHKKWDVNDVRNYRPISVLSISSKIIKCIAHRQFYDYLIKHSVLNKAQFGFRPGHSTGSALASFKARVPLYEFEQEVCRTAKKLTSWQFLTIRLEVSSAHNYS